MFSRKEINFWLFVLVAMYIAAFSYGVHAVLVRPNTASHIDFFDAPPYKSWQTIRTTLILTNSYVDTNVLNANEFSKMAILFDLTKGSLTSIQYQIWISYNQIDWYVEATETVGAGTITDDAANGTTTPAGDVKYFKPLDCFAPYLKLSIKGTGTVTNSAAAIHILGVI